MDIFFLNGQDRIIQLFISVISVFDMGGRDKGQGVGGWGGGLVKDDENLQKPINNIHNKNNGDNNDKEDNDENYDNSHKTTI